MGDQSYNAVPPPSSRPEPSKTDISRDAYEAALRRAKEIARNMADSRDGDAPPPSRKRGFEERASEEEVPRDKDGESSPKKEYLELHEAPVPRRLGKIDPAKAIAEARAKAAMFVAQSRGQVVTGIVSEDLKIPNSCVGLIIGRGGEVISKLQAESLANIQVAPDGPMSQAERDISITGTPECVEKAKRMIAEIIGGRCGFGDVCVEEIWVPGPKVGMVIGKGGETIKRLQETAGCRIVILQESNAINKEGKPLRMTGPREAVEKAKGIVEDILRQGDTDTPSRLGAGEILINVKVPRELVGYVIGKQGDNIRRIQQESGCRCHFSPEEDGPFRMAVLSGLEDGVRHAERIIHDMLDAASQRGGMAGPLKPGMKQVNVIVPVNKTGVIIGRGGETIRGMQQQSGAHIELNKQEDPPSAGDKYFVIRGTDEQIAIASKLIRDRLEPPPSAPGYDTQQIYNTCYQYALTAGQPPEAAHAYATYYQQYYGQAIAAGIIDPSQITTPGAEGAMGAAVTPAGGAQQQGGEGGGEAAPAPAAPAAAPAAAPEGGQGDYSAQWAEYYRQMGYQMPAGNEGAERATAEQSNQPQAAEGQDPAAAAAAAQQYQQYQQQQYHQQQYPYPYNAEAGAAQQMPGGPPPGMMPPPPPGPPPPPMAAPSGAEKNILSFSPSLLGRKETEPDVSAALRYLAQCTSGSS